MSIHTFEPAAWVALVCIQMYELFREQKTADMFQVLILLRNM